MARAHRVNTTAEHLGAAVVAEFFVAEQHPRLNKEVNAGIEKDYATKGFVQDIERPTVKKKDFRHETLYDLLAAKLS